MTTDLTPEALEAPPVLEPTGIGAVVVARFYATAARARFIHLGGGDWIDTALRSHYGFSSLRDVVVKSEGWTPDE
jgi:hypothetical protein